jgi:ABC-type multidrug transport system fused ATPase/permease subunit
MMQNLLYLPVPMSFFVASAITTFVALAGLYLVRRRYPAEVLKENHEVAAIIFNAFGLFYGVMVAFVVFVTWSGYSDATKSLQMEANDADDIFHSTEAFPEPARSVIKKELTNYVNSVYNDELKKMDRGQVTLHARGPLHHLMEVFYDTDATFFSNRELYAETLRRLNNLAQDRRLRIFAANDTVPEAIWLVLLVGGLFTVLYTFFFGMKNIRAQYVITTTLTVTITLILFLIYVLDHPFTGTSKVSAEPLKEVIDVMQKE